MTNHKTVLLMGGDGIGPEVTEQGARVLSWFADRRVWQKEIKRMLSNGFKMEVESLITKDISYVTETYVPERLKAKDWID